MLILLSVVSIAAAMGAEAWLSRRHAARLRAAGAVEPDGDVYWIMQLAYPASFVAQVGEAIARGSIDASWWAVGAAVWVAAKLLKVWVIASLRGRWTFRVLVPPEGRLVTTGPYRVWRHPNYLAVMGELVGTAIALQAPVAGVVSFAGFGALIRQRIRVEERALGRATDPPAPRAPRKQSADRL